MSVELSPASTLGFPRPLTQLVKRSLLIHNPHPSPLAFKVKTTAPKQYTVRPNSGRIEAGESVEIQILLQPLAQEPPPHAKCKDKFLVQSAFIRPDDEMKPLAVMWSETEKANKSDIQEQKIKCAYLVSEDGSFRQNGIPEESEEGLATGDTSRFVDESQIYSAAPSSPAHATSQETELPGNAANTTHSTGISLPSMGDILPSTNSTSTPTSREISQQSEPNTQSTFQPQLPSLTATDIQNVGVSPTNAALEQSLATTSSDSDRLNIALKEIDKLRAQLADAQGPQATGLRRRGTGGDAKAGAETAVEKVKEAVSASNGVPLEVVVGVAVGVFVLTYLFF